MLPNDFHAFYRLADLHVKLFFLKTHYQVVFKLLTNKSNSQ